MLSLPLLDLYNSLMLIGKEIFRILCFITVFTVLGQIPIRGQNLENRYHVIVNSERFQRNFKKTLWSLARPLTWAGETITNLFPSEMVAEIKKKGAVIKDGAQGR